MKRSGLIVAMFVLVSLLFVGLRYFPEASATTLYVGGAGPGNYTAIQEAIDNAGPGDVIYVFSGTYNESIIIGTPITLVGEDREATTIDGKGLGDVISVAADNVSIAEFTIKGESGHQFYEAVVSLKHVRNCYIAHNDISSYRTGSDNSAIYLESSDSNIIMSNTISSDWDGIRIEESNNNLIQENQIHGNHANGVHVRRSDSNTFSNNSFSLNKNGIFIYNSTRTILTANSFAFEGVFISGDSLEHWNTHSIDISNTVNGKPVHYWKDIVGGMIPPGAGQVILANTSNIIVESQNVSDGNVGILLGFSVNNTIARNTVTSNKYSGLYLFASSNITVASNNLSHNVYGVMFYSSTNVILTSNNISYNYWGIRFFHSRNVTVTRNVLFNNTCDGIYFDYSNNVTIAVNNVSHNGNVPAHLYAGIHSYFSSNVTITGNGISRNNYGIYLFYSTNITVHHNEIINNTVQASDTEGNENSWDDNYPLGGNFWSDYTGADDCSGPNQDICNDPDGIGDTPYIIDADSQDRYPLMYHFGTVFPRPPTDLHAELGGRESENVTLHWSLSEDDGTGLQSVVGYVIYRNSTYEHEGLGYQLIASVPNGTSKYSDSYAGEGDSSNYFYIVCAKNTTNSSTCTADQASKFTRPLPQGPNLVSVPLIQFNESIETVLQTVMYDKALFYDSRTREWKWHMTYKGYRRGLWSVNHTMGLWINVTEGCNLTIAGVVPARSIAHLHKGWNLVGFPSLNATYSVSDLKADAGVVRVEGRDFPPPHYLRMLVDAEVLQAGFGYWVKVEADTVWTISFH